MKVVYGSINLPVTERIKFFAGEVAQKYNFRQKEASAVIWFAETEIETEDTKQFVFDVIAYFRQQDIGNSVKVVESNQSVILSGLGCRFSNDMFMFSIACDSEENWAIRKNIRKVAQERIGVKTIFFSAKEKYLRGLISRNGWARKILKGEKIHFFIHRKELWLGEIINFLSDPDIIMDGIYLGFADPSSVALFVPEQCSMIIPQNEGQCEDIIVDLILREIPYIELAFLQGDR